MKQPKASRRRRLWWSVVLFIPGLAGVLLAECAVRISPELIAILGVACVVFPLSWLLMVVGTIGAFRTRKWKWGILGLVVFGLSFPQAESTWGWVQPSAADSESVGGRRVKVMSWNVRQFNRFAWIGVPGVQDSILARMKRSDADVICIQETYLEATSGREARSNPWMSRDMLKRRTGLTHLTEEFALGRGTDKLFGLVVLSRYPVVNKQSIRFENDRNNSAMSVDLAIEGDTVRVFNIHLSSIGFEEADYEDARNVTNEGARLRILDRLKVAWAKRASQAREVASAASRSPHPVIVAGDFNDTPVSYAAHQMSSCLVDGYQRSGFWNAPALGGTYQGDLPFLRIDQMWHSPILECTDYRTVDVAFSDHRPIEGTFLLPSDGE
jgi:endonuclease/exonuclease/phosphatase (EEP) superfamily protein YafD